MTSSPLTLLICGAGSRGRTIYGQFALNNPEIVKVVAVAEPNAERRHLMAREHQIDEGLQFTDWSQTLEQGKLADIVIVATNDREHVEPSLAFLRAGYHLLLEKPMAENLEDCEKIARAAGAAPGMSAIAHVLRYTNYFRTLRNLILEGKVGQVVSIRHFEPVNYWHFAHSFVRGNWRNSEMTAPFILAKCCHDMDILLFLMGEQPVAVSSFGRVSHFCAQAAPAKAAHRCVDCELKNDCVYSATRFYGGMLDAGNHGWPLDVLISEFKEGALQTALSDGPYGRCVYHCDNNVCDHQVVNLEFESGATASMVATAFTDHPARETEIYGSAGMLKGDGLSILHRDFQTGLDTVHETHSEGTHLGGDEGMLREFFKAVREDRAEDLSSSPQVSLLSHKMALLAEKARLERRVIRIE